MTQIRQTLLSFASLNRTHAKLTGPGFDLGWFLLVKAGLGWFQLDWVNLGRLCQFRLIYASLG